MLSRLPRRVATALAGGVLTAGVLTAGAAAVPVAESPAATGPALVRVHAPASADRAQLAGLGLDLTPRAGAGFVDALVHGPDDLARLRAAGLRWTVLESDLGERQRRYRELDQRLAAQTAVSPLPSGRIAYRTLGDYERELRELAARYPELVRLVRLDHQTLEGRWVYGVEIAHGVQMPDGRPVFLLMGLHHAREWPSGEHAMEFAYDLVRHAYTDPRIARLLRGGRALIVPVVNPDGFEKSRAAGALEWKRKNCRQWDGVVEHPVAECATYADNGLTSRGVDVNRNYGGFWGGRGSSDQWWAQDYRGQAPFSEPETRNVRDLVASRQVTVLISNHTYGNLVLRSPGVAGGNAPEESLYQALGDRMATQNGYTSQAAYQLYPTNGTVEDWVYYATGALGYTFEINPKDFHPDFGSAVIDEYLGHGVYAGKGNREAYLVAFETAVDPGYHGVVTGFAPVGAVLRAVKEFTMRTDDPGGSASGPIAFRQRLESAMTVTGPRFTWHLNPSLRPSQEPGVGLLPESWTLSCTRPDGTVLETQQVTVARGQRVEVRFDRCLARFAVR
ncbi:M14 family metallopeptidase [Carbonactinospora thermoautotrophica]|uniref:M14 family metallopeptidase n=1 Tax=Carbonactinospora thermoautotrophica TaxID=1469144 RepID=UPI003DA9ADA2